MPSQPLNIIGGWYSDVAKPWAQQDICNYIPFVSEMQGTLSTVKAVDAPGLKPFVEITDGGAIRGGENVEGKLLVVSGDTLYQISNAGVAIPRGTIPGTGLVSIDYNQQGIANQVLIGNGSAGYVYDTAALTLERITDPGFPGTKAVAYLDSYLLGVEPLGRFWFHSDLADAESYNTIDRYEAETSPDRIVTLAVSNEEVVVFGQSTTDFFVNTGATTGTFQSKGVSMDVGCASAASVVKLDNTLFWLDNYGVFQRLNGYSPQPVSTRVLEAAISGFDWTRCRAMVYQDKGRKIVYWTFPGQLTIGYDVTTGLWHRRQAYGKASDRLSCIVNWNKKWIAGDYQTGRLYEMDWDYMLQVDEPHVRRLVTMPLQRNGNRLNLHRLKLQFDTGGAETIAIPFPAQPEGPSIELTLPDGNVGEMWPGATAIATGGTPPYTFTTRSGTSYPGNLGPMSLGGVIPAEVPTTAGVGTVVVRVTDANGLYAETSDTFVIAVLLEWIMSGGFTDAMYFKRSPDGVDWSENSTTELANRVTLYRSGDNILGMNGTGSFYSTDKGVTFDSVSFTVFPTSNFGNDRAGFANGLWNVGSTPGGSSTMDPATGTVTNNGINAYKLIAYEEKIYTIPGAVAHQVIERDNEWVQTGTCTFRAPAQIATHTLGAGDGDVVLLYNDESDNAYLGRVLDPTIEVLDCPFTTFDYEASAFIKYSAGLGLWVLVCGTRIAYGPTIDDLTLSAHVLPDIDVVNSIDEDGTKFVIVGADNLAIMSVDGDTWIDLTVSDTFSGTVLHSALALGNSTDE